jgi:L-alanine-DL-glutamate epimerase-like enolase superfamily enzyme
MKIVDIDTFPISQTVNPQLAIVSAAGKHPESHYLVVRIRTDEGVTGFGEATVVPVWSGENAAGAQHIVRALFAPLLLGADPLQFGLLAQAMDGAVIGNPFIKAAVEMALLDVAARSLNVPVHVFLGGPRRPPEIGLKFSIGAFTPIEAARVARHAVQLGLRAVKVKVGLDVSGDIARVESVRSTVGDDFRVAVDANGGWTEADARRAIPHLERLNVNALEQPLRRGDFRGSARLRQQTSIPLMLDESIFTPGDALQAIREEACDLISIYPGKNGGILRSLEIAQMAASAGLKCVIGSNLEMDLGTAAMLHTAVAVPQLATSVDHDVIGPLYYEHHYTAAPIRYRNGCAVLPDGPGLGIEIELPEELDRTR